MSDAERFWGVLACPVDALAGIPPQDRIYWVVRLARYLYRDLREGTGGPLHIQLDDGNMDDHFVRPDPERYEYLWDGRYERYAQAGDNTSKEHKTAIQDTCERILVLLRLMPEVERRAAYRVLHGELHLNREPMQLGEPVELDDWDDEPDAGEDDIEPGPKACAPIPCPPFEEVTLGGPPMLTLEDALRATIPAPKIPRVVVVPSHITMEQAEQALWVCRDLGLLQNAPNGVMLLRPDDPS